ncbi:ABC transporter ATP-binding protein [Nitrososphaera sp. AFS]|uniref:ABC transporter ATP-binding protein n=1 Tax=Nitrososphaera sp. AFS TaxID=2301191 RepID=UPI001F2DC161|nr:ABC transporter ATP-binding protein [Nitrososphaera sp. AFS]
MIPSASYEAYSSEATLAVEKLTKVYDSSMGRVISLSNVSFSVNRGEFVAVVGPSGSGKSTLLNMIGALDRPTSGKVFMNGIDIFSLNDSQIAEVRNSTLGFIFQSYNLINRTSVLKNVEFPGITGGMSDADRRRRALKLLNFLGIKDKAKFKPTNLSGGQQQRVAIARALMNDPKVILADEPTGNLDTKTGNDVFNLMTLLSRKFKRTIIMVTHNPELAEATDRAIHIRDGKIEKEVINVERH